MKNGCSVIFMIFCCYWEYRKFKAFDVILRPLRDFE